MTLECLVAVVVERHCMFMHRSVVNIPEGGDELGEWWRRSEPSIDCTFFRGAENWRDLNPDQVGMEVRPLLAWILTSCNAML